MRSDTVDGQLHETHAQVYCGLVFALDNEKVISPGCTGPTTLFGRPGSVSELPTNCPELPCPPPRTNDAEPVIQSEGVDPLRMAIPLA
jgi:hypothetical protein